MSDKSTVQRAKEAQECDELLKRCFVQQDAYTLTIAEALYAQKRRNNFKLVMGDDSATWYDYCTYELKRAPDHCTLLARIHEVLTINLGFNPKELIGLNKNKLYKLVRYATQRLKVVSVMVVKQEIRELIKRRRDYTDKDFNNLMQKVLERGKTISEVENCSHERQGTTQFETFSYLKCSECGEIQHQGRTQKRNDVGAHQVGGGSRAEDSGESSGAL